MLYLPVPWTALDLVDYFFVRRGQVVSGLAYLVVSRSLDLAPERAVIEASEREVHSIDQQESHE